MRWTIVVLLLKQQEFLSNINYLFIFCWEKLQPVICDEAVFVCALDNSLDAFWATQRNQRKAGQCSRSLKYVQACALRAGFSV